MDKKKVSLAVDEDGRVHHFSYTSFTGEEESQQRFSNTSKEISSTSILPECETYQDRHVVVEKMLDAIFEKAYRVLQEVNNIQIIKPKKRRRLTKPKFPCPAIETVDEVIGAQCIKDYLKAKTFDEDWTYSVNFMSEKTTALGSTLCYETIWAIPTKTRPIAPATASIFFHIEKSILKPPCCPVDVYYRYENSRTIRNINQHDIQEHWLNQIINNKLRVYNKILF